MKLHLVHLYPVEMNIYGDTGNRLVLQQRLKWRGIDVQTSLVGLNEPVPDDSDIIIGGGGQDAVQSNVQSDLQHKAKVLHTLANNGVVMLLVCGCYQLFGRRFITTEGEEIKGINILPMETQAGPRRLIGNTVFTTQWGEVVGYENHSGLTQLDSAAKPFGTMSKGAGNNGHDNTEGCIVNNVFGTYCHGPILSKNPFIADELIRRALVRKYGGKKGLKSLDDKLELQAAQIAKSRPR